MLEPLLIEWFSSLHRLAEHIESVGYRVTLAQFCIRVMWAIRVHSHGNVCSQCGMCACARSVFSAASPADVAPADGPDSPIAMVVQLVSQTLAHCLLTVSPSAAQKKTRMRARPTDVRTAVDALCMSATAVHILPTACANIGKN